MARARTPAPCGTYKTVEQSVANQALAAGRTARANTVDPASPGIGGGAACVVLVALGV